MAVTPSVGITGCRAVPIRWLAASPISSKSSTILVSPLPSELTMSHSTAKDLLQEAADHLPEGASVEDAIERLLFLAKIERGKADREADRLVEHDEVKRRLGL